mgnify:FL=1
MKYELELTDECVGDIVRQDLKVIYECMECDLNAISRRKNGYVFSTDKKEDMKEIKKFMSAIKIVLDYYGKD